MPAMDHANRQEPLESGRRSPITVNLAPEIIEELAAIGEGNRSKGIELLVREHIARTRPETV
jgi:hypothetical protein